MPCSTNLAVGFPKVSTSGILFQVVHVTIEAKSGSVSQSVIASIIFL